MQNRLSRVRTYVGDLIQRARDFIYKKGLNVTGAAVERLLHEHSWTPTTVRYPSNHCLVVVILTSCLEHFFQKIGLIGSGSVQNTGR
jgi:hypothetical protein